MEYEDVVKRVREYPHRVWDAKLLAQSLQVITATEAGQLLHTLWVEGVVKVWGIRKENWLETRYKSVRRNDGQYQQLYFTKKVSEDNE